MRRIAIAILTLFAALLADTQEAAYLRAMQAEEAGNITLAILCFEEALDEEGPYTEEIQEILNDYYDALGVPGVKRRVGPGKNFSEKSFYSFRFLGEAYGIGMNYVTTDQGAEWGAMTQGAFSAFLDYSSGNLIHSFGVNLLADMNFNNDNLSTLDTNDWKGSVGLEYMLVSEKLLLDAGVDLSVYEKAKMSPAFYTWLEYDIYKKEKQKVGVALWAYDDLSGPLSVALYGSWKKTAIYGFSFSLMAGPRMEVDSVFDYMAYKSDYESALDAVEAEMNEYSGIQFGTNPFEKCLEIYGDQCYGWDIASIDSLNWVTHYEELLNGIDVKSTKYWTKWFGPSLRGRVLYKFGNGFSLESSLNLFYSFVLDGPDTGYEKISKLSAIWSGTALWNLGVSEIFCTIDEVYKMYCLPSSYEHVYPKHSNLLKLKIGSRWTF